MNLLNKILITLFFCSVYSLALRGHALPSDNQQPITLQSDHAEFDRKKGTTTYSGSVIMEQGSMLINADKVIIFGKTKDVTKIIAKGNPASFQQTPQENTKPVKATGNTLEYRIDKKILYLVDNARLQQEGSVLSGPKIVYDVKQSVVKAGETTQNPSNRIKMIIPPAN